MKLTELLKTPGEHPFRLQGGAGQLEGVLTVPTQSRKALLAVLGHPHSLQGGTMNNKVVTTTARAFKELGIPSIRFNFRGVGLSEGVYDAGIGESEDMLELVQQWQAVRPDTKVLFAGFSFGSYVAFRAARQHDHALLITIAPPVHHYDYNAFTHRPDPWVIVQGDADEVVPLQRVLDYVQDNNPSIPVLQFADTGHFFHGKLIDLKTRLMDIIRVQVALV